MIPIISTSSCSPIACEVCENQAPKALQRNLVQRSQLLCVDVIMFSCLIKKHQKKQKKTCGNNNDLAKECKRNQRVKMNYFRPKNNSYSMTLLIDTEIQTYFYQRVSKIYKQSKTHFVQIHDKLHFLSFDCLGKPIFSFDKCPNGKEFL